MEEKTGNIYGAERECGQFTQYAQDYLIGWENFNVLDGENAEEDLERFCETIQKDINFSRFEEGLKAAAWCHGCNSDKDTEIVAFILDCAEQRGIDLARTTIRKWVVGESSPQSKRTSITRENIYKLCFALNFTLQETADFFYRVYLDRPFNTRDLTEAVYLYCLNRQRPYADAKHLIETVQPLIENKAGKHIADTRRMNESFLNLYTDEEFVSFCVANAASFSGNNQTAIRTFNSLLEETRSLINCEKSASADVILEKLCGFSSNEKSNKAAAAEKIIHAAAYTNFPSKIEFSNAKKGTVSSDALRKLLILLKFFVFFENVSKVNDIIDPFVDFVEETNDMLYSCAYVPLYARNPYDWLFLFSASEERNGNQNIWLDRFHQIMWIIFPPSEEN